MKAVAAGAALAVAFLSTTADAFWRLPCGGPVLVERADPLVNPGKVAGHLHTIMGGNGFGFTMDYEQARNSTCSTCSVKEDLSNYWTPNLFYKAQNGSFHPVEQMGGALVYYLQRRANNAEKLLAFPEGFQMLAGDPSLRSYSDTKEQKAVSYACLNYGGDATPETHGFPNRNCPNGLRMQVFFPSCWNGKDLDSPDHKSHVAYPDGVDSGKCPSTHPHRLISIFYEVLFDINKWKDEWYDGWPFVLSNGDPTGYGFHGDFVNGWDIEVLQKAVDGCNSDSGVVEECQFFSFFDKKVQNDCYLPQRIDEPTTGWMDKLPGCNPVQAGPGRATAPTNCDATTVIGDPKKDYTDVSAMGWSYDGCALDSLDARTFPIRMGDSKLTIEMCIEYCDSKGQTYAGLQYANECYCGNSIAADRKGDYKCTMPCAGNPNQICGDGQRLSVYKKGVSSSPKPSSPTSNLYTTAKIQATSTIKPAAPTTTVITTKIATTAKTQTTSTTTTKIQTSSTIKSTAPTSTPTTSVPATNWISKGCYLDPVNPTRTLPNMGWWGEKITNAGCTNYCQSKGFKYAGTEYAGQCFCGNDISLGKKMPDADCNMACEGNPKEMCGGPGRLTLWENTKATKKARSIPRIARNLYKRGFFA